VGGNDKNPAWFHLIKTTKEALDLWIEMIKPNAPVINFSQKVYQHLINHNCSIIKPLTGHGVGNYVHEWPYIYNYPCPQAQHTILQKNMVIALEPITAEESDDFIQDPRNERNLYTQQGDLWAQREYTVVVTDQGAEILAWVKENLRS
jgi:methionyl aminopeptidase